MSTTWRVEFPNRKQVETHIRAHNLRARAVVVDNLGGIALQFLFFCFPLSLFYFCIIGWESALLCIIGVLLELHWEVMESWLHFGTFFFSSSFVQFFFLLLSPYLFHSYHISLFLAYKYSHHLFHSNHLLLFLGCKYLF